MHFHLLLYWLICANASPILMKNERENESDSSKLSVQRTSNEGTFSQENAYEELTTQTEKESSAKNSTKEFKPSVHLGEIDESKSNLNPFNNVQHIKFENTLNLQPLLEDHGTIGQDLLVGDPRTHATQHRNCVKFENEISSAFANADVAKPDHRQFFPDLQTSQPLQVAFDSNARPNPEGIVKQTFVRDPISIFHAIMKKFRTPTATFLPKPSKFHNDETQSTILPSAHFNGGDQKEPYFFPDHHVIDAYDHRPDVQEATYASGNSKPDGSVLYLSQQQEYVRLRKQPHHFFQQLMDHPGMNFVGGKPSLVAVDERGVSPWKRIAHLIGALLPLGLLLAALTPNVVKIDNTTEPNIVLSKLRVVDLPIEHKQARAESEQPHNACEHRTICELILTGGKPHSNVLQTVLWNLANGKSDEFAKAAGLREIFDAAQRSNCSGIPC